MKVNDIVIFSKESFFNGAVQTEWFYDDDKIGVIAESYVFHGPKYYGVSSVDVASGEHRLLDTASFAKNLADKLYSEKPDNSFVMTIAGYGTGKSHLAVCLGALFSGESVIAESVIRNISAADAKIGDYIRIKNRRKNLVIVLNGMNNFNLDAEVLRCARRALARFGISDALLQKITKSYDIAKHFVERMFEFCRDRFDWAAQKYGLNLSGTALKNYLISYVETDNKALEIINAVYEEVNGDKIAWDRGLSAGDVLLTLQRELCGEGKPFNKILLLFDEFGRYIEYTAANPTIAGEAALQQIFEAIQTANGKIIFAGFIQSELKAYLSRIEKTANITRYIDRYRTACENLFLSSNFETILASILKKRSPDFDRVVGNALRHYENFYNKMKTALSRWDRAAVKKSVWSSDDLYRSVVLMGCYPLHPITVWLLSSSHQWMQQRSTLAFAAEMFEQVGKEKIEDTWLPYIYPVQIIDSGIFNEMLNAEEKGLVSSQYCMLYRDILVKIGDKLSDLEKTILKAVLVVNMGHMSFRDKDDAILAIRYCSNVTEDEVKYALKSLEDMHGVIAFDEHAKTYDLIAEANGFNEFRRIFAKYRLGIKVSVDDLDESVLAQISMTTPVETSFGQDNHISSTEWGFNRWLADTSNITEWYLREAIKASTDNCDGEKMRGVLIYAYCHEDADKEVARISVLYRTLNIESYPVIILFLDDNDGEILSALSVKKALQKFSVSDKERFQKHIAAQQRAQNNKIIRKFTSCIAQRFVIGTSGLETYSVRINVLCTQCFSRLYYKAIPFSFDGFENKSKIQAKGTLISLCVGLLNQTLMNAQVYTSLTPKDKNRVAAVMSTKSPYSWQIFDDNCQLVNPKHPVVDEIVKEVVSLLENGERMSVFALFGKYMLSPYGMNENSLALLVSYFIAYHGNRYLYSIGTERLNSKHWTDSKGKLKLPEIKRIYIQKNENINVDLVGDLCKKILATTSVEQCIDLKNALDTLVAQEGETEQNKYLIAQAKAYLDEGVRLRKAIYEKLSKVQSVINEAKEKFSIIKVVKVFEMIPKITPVIEDGYPFVYSDEYNKLVLKLQEDLKKLLEQSYLYVMQRTKCSITELSQFKLTYTRVAQILRNNGYEEFAATTERHIKDVESELLAKQYYERSLIECEKDVMLCSTAVKYQECERLMEKLQSWLGFIDSAVDLPVSVSHPLRNRIEDAIALMNQHITDISNDYHSAVTAVAAAMTIADLQHANNKLDQLLQMQLPEEFVHNIVVVRESIDSAINYIENLPKDLDSLELVIEQISEKMNPHCSLTIKCCAEKIRDNLKKEEMIWIAGYIDGVEKTYHTMSPKECMTWINRTKSIPTYLSSMTRERYNKVRELIEKQLHAARVEGLLTMYDELTLGEKAEFKRLLSQRF